MEKLKLIDLTCACRHCTVIKLIVAFVVHTVVKRPVVLHLIVEDKVASERNTSSIPLLQSMISSLSSQT